MARARGPSSRAAPVADRSTWPARIAPWLALAGCLAAAAWAYAPALDGPFQLDDWNAIQANARVRGPAPPAPPGLADLLGPGRRVTELTFAADWRASGGDPRRFHVTSLLLHLAASALSFLYARSLLARALHPRPAGVAAAVAGFFALHPVQSEAVAYAAQRSEILASLLALVALLLLDRAAAARRPWTGAASWLAGLVTWIAAMGAKSIAIATPGAFVLDQGTVAPGTGTGPRVLSRLLRALLLAAPLLALGAWSAALHLGGFEENPGGGAGFSATAVGPGAYLRTQLRVQWLYLRLLAWPHPLGIDRTFEPSGGWDGATLLAAAGAAALVGLAIGLWARSERSPGPAPASRVAAFGILFWFVALAPTSSIVPVVDLAVEHRVYLAMLGPALAVSVGADAALRRLLPAPRASWVAAAGAAAVLAVLGAALHERARVWRSAESLWRDADRTSPGNPRILTNLGLALQLSGDLAAADAAYRAAWAVAERPLHVVGLARNHSSLLVDGGQPAAALPVLERGLRLAPDDPDLRGNRAAALVALGRIPEALGEARRAAAAAPDSSFFRELLGRVLAVAGAHSEAAAEFEAAGRLDPDEPSHAVARAEALSSAGRTEEACAAFRALRARFPPGRLPPDLPRRVAAAGCPPG